MNRRKNKIYAKLDEDALNLRIDYGFWDYYVDVFKLAQYLGMNLIPYSSMTEKQWERIVVNIDIKDGFTIIQNVGGERKYYTYYNDSLSIRRQRYTIAHEIKHVVYVEEEFDEENEAFADHFARALLAPSCLVMFAMQNHNVLELSDLFVLSVEATTNAMKAAKNRIKARGMELNQYEIIYIDYRKINKNIKENNS